MRAEEREQQAEKRAEEAERRARREEQRAAREVLRTERKDAAQLLEQMRLSLLCMTESLRNDTVPHECGHTYTALIDEYEALLSRYVDDQTIQDDLRELRDVAQQAIDYDWTLDTRLPE
jgi:hypothetical protein